MRRHTEVLVFKVMTITILILFGAVVFLAETLEDRNTQIAELREQVWILEHSPERGIEPNSGQNYEQDAEPESAPDLRQMLEDANEQPDMEYIGEFKCTAYCTEKYEHICGEGHGITASGEPVQAGVTVAVGDTINLPYGTVVYIEGIGVRTVQDTGGGLADNQIDIAMGTHEEALEWGYQNLKVYVIKDGDIA